jgi:hypothetical protein
MANTSHELADYAPLSPNDFPIVEALAERVLDFQYY